MRPKIQTMYGEHGTRPDQTRRFAIKLHRPKLDQYHQISRQATSSSSIITNMAITVRTDLYSSAMSYKNVDNNQVDPVTITIQSSSIGDEPKSLPSVSRSSWSTDCEQTPVVWVYGMDNYQQHHSRTSMPQILDQCGTILNTLDQLDRLLDQLYKMDWKK